MPAESVHARPDDIASLVLVYPLADPATLPAGKQISMANANSLNGNVTFPNGMGMAGVNVLVRRQLTFTQTTDDFVEASGVTGAAYSRAPVPAFLSAPSDALSSMGDKRSGSAWPLSNRLAAVAG